MGKILLITSNLNRVGAKHNSKQIRIATFITI